MRKNIFCTLYPGSAQRNVKALKDIVNILQRNYEFFNIFYILLFIFFYFLFFLSIFYTMQF